MTNKYSVKQAQRLRRKDGLFRVRSAFETRMLAHIEARRAELQAIVDRGVK